MVRSVARQSPNRAYRAGTAPHRDPRAVRRRRPRTMTGAGTPSRGAVGAHPSFWAAPTGTREGDPDRGSDWLEADRGLAQGAVRVGPLETASARAEGQGREDASCA